MSRSRAAGFGAIVAAAVSCVSDASWAATAIYLDSPPGDPVGQGQEYNFVAPPSDIAASVANDRELTITFDGWELKLEPRPGQPLTPGNYDGARRYTYPTGPYPSLRLTAPSRGCDAADGWFEIHALAFTGTTVTLLSVDFVQSCDLAPSVFGAIRIGTDVPLTRSEPNARCYGDRHVTEGSTVVDNGGLSFDRQSGITMFQWAQLAGTPVGPAVSRPETLYVVAPNVGPDGETLQFELSVTDSDGNTDSRRCDVVVHDTTDLRTRAEFVNAADSPTFEWNYDEGSATIRAEVVGGTLNVAIESPIPSDLSFSVPAGALQTGTYAGTVSLIRRFIGRSNEGCIDSSGRFDIVELEASSGVVTRLALDFEHNCPGALGTSGAIRLNSDVPLRGRPAAGGGGPMQLPTLALLVLALVRRRRAEMALLKGEPLK